MQGGKLRQALVVIQDDMGNTMCLRETFALSNVSDRLLALGKLVKLGWRLENGDQVKLAYNEFSKSWDFRQNSLVMMAQIRKVDGEVPGGDLRVRQVTMTFEGHMQNLVITPGWHLSIDRRTPSCGGQLHALQGQLPPSQPCRLSIQVDGDPEGKDLGSGGSGREGPT